MLKPLAIALCFACVATDVQGKPRLEAIPRAAYAYRATLIREARFLWGLNAPTATFGSQVHTESGWRFRARNPSGAAGLGQLMPATARFMAKRHADLSPAAPFNPIWSLRAMLRYDLEIYRMTRDETACNRMKRTLAGYNAGPSRLYKRWPHETQRYVHRVLVQLEPHYINAGFGPGSCN
jgi:soluble lytic murein transglycosylase-like protein